jgi:hypothetical protein
MPQEPGRLADDNALPPWRSLALRHRGPFPIYGFVYVAIDQ